jgi:ribosomal protein L11 methylase PrmA
MSNSYLGFHFSVEPKELGSEILVAELGKLPFESFIDSDSGIVAYIQKQFWTENILDDLHILSSAEFQVSYTIEEIDQVNWNEEWEKNFEAIEVEKAGLKVTLKKTNENEIPEEFQLKLNQSTELKKAFEALTPGRQRGYLLHFAQPKQAKTREARIEKCIPQIFEGKGLND